MVVCIVHVVVHAFRLIRTALIQVLAVAIVVLQAIAAAIGGAMCRRIRYAKGPRLT